jgi:uncharacterized membrane protein YphA (DoxX/SURF4 family)
MTTFRVLSFFSGASFLFYGLSCIFSKQMEEEFKRFGIPQYTKLTGTLQILGGISLMIGVFLSPILAFMGSLGLSILMFMGFGVRLKIKDGVLVSTPALLFAFLNGFLAFKYYAML